MPPVQLVTLSALIAALPTWWDRLRARAKVIWTAMISRQNHVITLSDDGRRINLVDADKFNATQQKTGDSGPGVKAPTQNTETGA